MVRRPHERLSYTIIDVLPNCPRHVSSVEIMYPVFYHSLQDTEHRCVKVSRAGPQVIHAPPHTSFQPHTSTHLFHACTCAEVTRAAVRCRDPFQPHQPHYTRMSAADEDEEFGIGRCANCLINQLSTAPRSAPTLQVSFCRPWIISDGGAHMYMSCMRRKECR